MSKKYDVIVVGAGIVGQSLALGMAQQGLQVAIIDKIPSSELELEYEKPNKLTDNKLQLNKVQYSSRVSAISAASEKLFTRLDVWQHFARKQAYYNMCVWDQDGFGDINFSEHKPANFALGTHGIPNNINNTSLREPKALGHIIENEMINAALYAKIKQLKNVDCYFEHSLIAMETIEAAEYGATVSCQSNTKVPQVTNLQAKLLVGADGGNSKVREKFGFAHTFWDYDHSAIVANVNTEHAHGNTARQVFTPYGPLAFLPLPSPNQSSIVFSQQSQQAKVLLDMPKAEFEKTLQAAINNHYGKVSLISARVSFPLRMRYARQWTCKHVAIIGDAAHTIHPLAGQGANLGLADVNTLLTLLEQYPNKIGQVAMLRKYERCRKAEALKTIAIMQGFKDVFDGDHTFKKLVRNLGLLGADKLPGLKGFFKRQAMG